TRLGTRFAFLSWNARLFVGRTIMDRRSHQTRSLHARLHANPEAIVWLYDRTRGEFLDEPTTLNQLWPDVSFRVPAARRRWKTPKTRSGRLIYWLFANGGISVVFLLGLMILALVCALLGYY